MPFMPHATFHYGTAGDGMLQGIHARPRSSMAPIPSPASSECVYSSHFEACSRAAWEHGFDNKCRDSKPSLG